MPASSSKIPGSIPGFETGPFIVKPPQADHSKLYFRSRSRFRFRVSIRLRVRVKEVDGNRK